MEGAGPGIFGEASSGATASPRAGERRIVVQPGQQLGRIADAYHVPKRAIIAANHLEPPYKLAAGQKLLIPGAAPAREMAAAAPVVASPAPAPSAPTATSAPPPGAAAGRPSPDIIPPDGPGPPKSALPP